MRKATRKRKIPGHYHEFPVRYKFKHYSVLAANSRYFEYHHSSRRSMYLSFFSLSKKPFELLPNPEFLFLSHAHKKALTFLEYGLLEHTGFILFTGEVGTGKTTIIRRLLDKMPQDMTLAKIFSTQVNSAQLLRMINDDFGLISTSTDKADLLRDLYEFLVDQYAAGRRSILIIDEAQNLGAEQLEEIRLLSNLETAHAKLLQIILVGQPELREKLGSAALIQLRQRILVHCHLSPLNPQEVESYIFHRLAQAGNRNALQWEEGTMGVILSATRGIPRLINILSHYILLDAFSRNERFITCDSVDAILKHLDFEAQFWAKADSPAKDKASCHTSLVDERVATINASLTQIAATVKQMGDDLHSLQQLLSSLSQPFLTALQGGGKSFSKHERPSTLPRHRRMPTLYAKRIRTRKP